MHAVALVLVGALASGLWPALLWTRDRRDRARASAAALSAARRALAADWIAFTAYMDSVLAANRIIGALEPPSGAWERHADLIGAALPPEEWRVVVKAWLIVENTRRRMNALTHRLPLPIPTTSKDARAAFEDDDLAEIRKGIRVLDPTTWRGLADDGSVVPDTIV